MPDGRSKRLSSLFAFLRPRKSRGDKASIVGSDEGSRLSADNVSSRSRKASPSPRPAAAPATSSLSPPSSAAPVTNTLAPPPSTLGRGSAPSQLGGVYDASRTVSSATFGSRMSGLNEVDVANFPLPPNHALPPQTRARSSSRESTLTATPVTASSAKTVTRSESTPVFSLCDDMPDLTLSNPSARAQQSRASFSPPKGREGFLRRASSVGLRLAGQADSKHSKPKSRPQSLLPPPQIPQIDLTFDVGRMDVDFNPAKQPTSRSTTTLPL